MTQQVLMAGSGKITQLEQIALLSQRSAPRAATRRRGGYATHVNATGRKGVTKNLFSKKQSNFERLP
jgi:hypothetical protein